MSTIHIEAKKNEIAPLVIMPGDPRRAEYIANKFLKKVKLVNEVRGQLAYTGYYKNKRVTIMSSGMGIPSMGIYSHELFSEYDVEAIIRIGTCGSRDKKRQLGDLILASTAYSDTNYDVELLGYEKKEIDADKLLNKIILDTTKDLNYKIFEDVIHTTEAFYEKSSDSKLTIVEMEAFALFINALKLNKKASCILTLTDIIGTDQSLTSKEREIGLDKMVTLALESITLL